MVYFPNGSSAGILDQQCAECRIPGDAPCPVLHVQLTYNYEQNKDEKLKDAMNLLINEDGKCLMKPLLDALKYDTSGKPTFRPPMVGDSSRPRFTAAEKE